MNNVNPKLPLNEGNLRLQLQNEAWSVPSDVVRRAGVSALIRRHERTRHGRGAGSVTPDNDYEEPMSNNRENEASVRLWLQLQTLRRPKASPAAASHDAVYQTIVSVVCERTGYAADEIESDFELEADLGIDTVKQAEIMAQVREVYGLEADTEFRLAIPTLRRLADYVVERMGLSGGTKGAGRVNVFSGSTPVVPQGRIADLSIQNSKKSDAPVAGSRNPRALRGILAVSELAEKRRLKIEKAFKPRDTA